MAKKINGIVILVSVVALPGVECLVCIVIWSTYYGPGDVAVYENMALTGVRGVSYRTLATGPGVDGLGIAPLYVHLVEPEGVIYLPDLDEATLEPLAQSSEFIDDPDGGFTYYESKGLTIYFRKGALDSAYLTPPVTFSLTRDGPKLPLPITHDDMVATFGQPLSYHDATPSSAP